ncbi:WavE lipopolysaccharide synthesis family protein [Butyrivibrio sp. YAB3001]|uniref:WavE lipopolysaccharide synthesis family protein n=1 Tax=Butyrivibrio sp. YAB3001 TaxID=1520812 RepID=UPI0008F67155|nr:WavE lipopolysaccharide synthesis family protein [Butyrivibrio sp. YAB3001]SFB95038.1 WavE lipopolysaccharide synthesis [Butyrivibrio sp. YAB3001]
MIDKRDLISFFNKIENHTIELLREKEINSFKKLAVILLSELNVLAKEVNELLQVIKENNKEDSALQARAESSNGTIMEQILKTMTIINMLLNEEIGLDTAKNELSKLEGDIALSIRFEIACLPVIVSENIEVAKIFYEMKEFWDRHNDYMIAEYLFQNSVWKFFPKIEIDDVAIVIQGQVIYENDFTLETIYRYRRIYPRITIILSTWEGEVSDDFRWQTEAIGVVILENEMPEEHGASNICLQLKSSLEGTLWAQENSDVKYVLKTRTDQRIFLPDFLTYMKNMLKTFKVSSDGMAERIIFLGGFQSSVVCPFEVSDFLAFGNVGDIRNLYSSSGIDEKLIYNGMSNPDYRNTRAAVLRDSSHYDNIYAVYEMSPDERKLQCNKLMKYLDPETYIALSFYERVILKRKIDEAEDILEHYLTFLKECAVIVDSERLLFYWFKYENRFYYESSLVSMGSLTTSAWMDIYYSEK